MKRKWICLLLTLILGMSLLAGFSANQAAREDADTITCCRFALHDAAPLKDSLMGLSTTSPAGAIYDSYLTSFTNEDGSINWLPLCADVHGFITNKGLFEQYNLPLPTDYDSFVAACNAFEALGTWGYVGDYAYDYTCWETLQGLSIPALTSLEGRS